MDQPNHRDEAMWANEYGFLDAIDKAGRMRSIDLRLAQAAGEDPQEAIIVAERRWGAAFGGASIQRDMYLDELIG
jgi:hypothetical protein